MSSVAILDSLRQRRVNKFVSDRFARKTSHASNFRASIRR